MFSFLQKFPTAYDIFPTENNWDDIGTDAFSYIGTDAFSERGSKATTLNVGTVSTSTVTGEESTQYISSALETTKSVLVDTNPDAHTGPTFTDPALLIKKTITQKVFLR